MHDLNEFLTLRGVGGAKVDEAGPDFVPARYLLHEWREYAVEWKNPEGRSGAISIRSLPRNAWKSIGGAALFTFRNQLGLARIEVEAGVASTAFWVEVLSPKFPTPDDHRRFYTPLIQRLSEQAAALPFTVEAPTTLRTRESLRPPSDIFTWHFLNRERANILAALRTVLSEPRRLLAE